MKFVKLLFCLLLVVAGEGGSAKSDFLMDVLTQLGVTADPPALDAGQAVAAWCAPDRMAALERALEGETLPP